MAQDKPYVQSVMPEDATLTITVTSSDGAESTFVGTRRQWESGTVGFTVNDKLGTTYGRLQLDVKAYLVNSRTEAQAKAAKEAKAAKAKA